MTRLETAPTNAGHGALFQYPKLFVNQVSLFQADWT